MVTCSYDVNVRKQLEELKRMIIFRVFSGDYDDQDIVNNVSAIFDNTQTDLAPDLEAVLIERLQSELKNPRNARPSLRF